jgi:hypothetical protein
MSKWDKSEKRRDLGNNMLQPLVAGEKGEKGEEAICRRSKVTCESKCRRLCAGPTTDPSPSL